MKKSQIKKLAKEFGLKDWSSGTYEEGLFAGILLAKKKLKRKKK
jgi:hypothetical protein